MSYSEIHIKYLPLSFIIKDKRVTEVIAPTSVMAEEIGRLLCAGVMYWHTAIDHGKETISMILGDREYRLGGDDTGGRVSLWGKKQKYGETTLRLKYMHNDVSVTVRWFVKKGEGELSPNEKRVLYNLGVAFGDSTNELKVILNLEEMVLEPSLRLEERGCSMGIQIYDSEVP